MRKNLIRALLPMGLAAAVIGVGAGAASAATPTTQAAPVAVQQGLVDQVPTLTDEWNQWNKGGAALGYGAASLISSAWLGAPQSILDLGKEAAGLPLIYSHGGLK
ncbi:MAG TPA: hypothetical protein VHX59_00500 [Mycobacteriales bacterium]|nr:hypothetical protein [Mycobacteriales bacterium]